MTKAEAIERAANIAEQMAISEEAWISACSGFEETESFRRSSEKLRECAKLIRDLVKETGK